MSSATTKIMPEWQVTLTIPKETRDRLKLSVGDEITFVCEEDKFIIANPAILAMQELQKAMEGEAERLGLHSEEDVIKWAEEVREEIWR